MQLLWSQGYVHICLLKYPELEAQYLKRMLVQNGDLLLNEVIPALKINVSKAVEKMGIDLRGQDPYSIAPEKESVAVVMRARTLTELIEEKEITREELWQQLNDESPVVRKTVISYGLKAPMNELERKKYWDYFRTSQREDGERIAWLYQLLMNAPSGELDQWMVLLNEQDLEITLCVKIYLGMNYSDAPEIPYHPDPDPEFITLTTNSVWDWYKEKQRGGIQWKDTWK
ncbi:hypothetical protein ACFVAD_22905 [Sutcliffiella sp. NPDC057660]|uniref:hypothetical protein n=1 Tax=Sutcliffiella sp. NPDC057660 TaxID=3346199 RepID=UPI00367FBB29